jgi:hypothetical protein
VQNHFALELVGYAASVLIAVSLMMTSLLRLRLINVAGSAVFSVYGLLIGAYPVAALNGFIVLVNGIHLAKIFRAKEYFQLLPLKPDSQYLPYFLKFYRQEIQRILPDFEYRPATNQLLLFVLRDCAPAGVFIAEQRPEGVLRVVLDFVIPRYRDLKIGRFLFVEQAAFFKERGVKEIIISPRTAEFGAYLVKVGFEPAAKSGEFHIRYATVAE